MHQQPSAGHAHQHPEPVTQGKPIRWAGHYDLFVRLLSLGRERAMRAEMIQRAGIQPGAKVLDVGCGTGTLTLMAKAAAGSSGRVYGIDAASEMIEVARQKAIKKRSDVDFRVGLIEAIPFPDATFDVVTSSLMFHHLPGTLKQSALADIYRVLKPGGRLLIVDMKRPSESAHRMSLILLAHYAMNVSVHDLVPLMEQSGYTSVQSGDMGWKTLGYVQGQRWS